MHQRIVLIDSLSFFVGHFRQILSLCLPFILVDAFAGIWLGSWESDAMNRRWMLPNPSTILSFLIYPIYTAALILYMQQCARKHVQGHVQTLKVALSYYYRPLLLVAMAELAVISIGLMLFVLPGVWIMVRLLLSEFYVVVHRQPVDQALKSSFEATRRPFWAILFLFAVAVAPRIAMELVFVHPLSSDDGRLLFEFAFQILGAIMLLFVDVVLFRVFMEIETRDERTDIH